MSATNLNSEHLDLVERCQNRLGYRFSNISLLHEALSHSSGAANRLLSNERLEFLGDAVLGFVVCELLFQENPSWLEGELTKIKSIVVSRKSCARFAQQLEIVEFLIVGKGVSASGEVPKSLLSNAFESILAAIYLDSDFETVRQFLIPLVRPLIKDAVEGDSQVNYKSALQQIAQKDYGVSPSYKVVDQKGPDHQKSFLVAAHIGKRSFHPAWGKNKKEAEQGAAANALEEFNGEAS